MLHLRAQPQEELPKIEIGPGPANPHPYAGLQDVVSFQENRGAAKETDLIRFPTSPRRDFGVLGHRTIDDPLWPDFGYRIPLESPVSPCQTAGGNGPHNLPAESAARPAR